MAITGGDRLVWRELRAADAIPENPAVLEIGRANWYGDIPSNVAVQDWREFAAPGQKLPGNVDVWAAADWYYDFMLRSPSRVAIDLDPIAEGAIRHNLNRPLPDGMNDSFEIVINTGTTEHIFDQRRVWESIHDAAKVGGLMVHAVPLWGWLDHGFVNYNPTFVADLAAENEYEILAWFIHEIKTGWAAPLSCPTDATQYQSRAATNSAMLHFAFRKTQPIRFRVPMQGVYSNRVTTNQKQTWHANR